MNNETFYIDCEFDGHNGPLLSIAMVRGDGKSIHLATMDNAADQWVKENVLSVMSDHKADESWTNLCLEEVGHYLRQFIGDCQNPTIIADSPVDIGRFCRAISTGFDGGWQSTDFPQMTLIVRNVDCYPTTLEGAVQHNAWWDAMALRAKLTPTPVAASEPYCWPCHYSGDCGGHAINPAAIRALKGKSQ